MLNHKSISACLFFYANSEPQTNAHYSCAASVAIAAVSGDVGPCADRPGGLKELRKSCIHCCEVHSRNMRKKKWKKKDLILWNLFLKSSEAWYSMTR